jgi:DNA-binding NarL/FixJ family response regulator
MRTVNELTNQEQRILALVATGQRNADIAIALSISRRTVEVHLYHIYDKLGLSSRLEAALYVLQQNLGTNTLSRLKQESGEAIASGPR